MSNSQVCPPSLAGFRCLHSCAKFRSFRPLLLLTLMFPAAAAAITANVFGQFNFARGGSALSWLGTKASTIAPRVERVAFTVCAPQSLRSTDRRAALWLLFGYLRFCRRCFMGRASELGAGGCCVECSSAAMRSPLRGKAASNCNICRRTQTNGVVGPIDDIFIYISIQLGGLHQRLREMSFYE